MADAYQKAFSKRLKRIDRIHRKGGGFEANGTLGQSHYTRQRARQRTPLWRPALTIVVLFLGFKAMVLAHEGPQNYLARLDALSQGTMVEQASAQILQIDPVTELFAVWLKPLLS